MLPNFLTILHILVPFMVSTYNVANSNISSYKYCTNVSYSNNFQQPVISDLAQQAYNRKYWFSYIDFQFNMKLYFNSDTDYVLKLESFNFSWDYYYSYDSSYVDLWEANCPFNDNVGFTQSTIDNFAPSILFGSFYDGAQDTASRYVQLYNNNVETYDLLIFDDTYFYDLAFYPYYAVQYIFDTSYLKNNINTYINNYLRYDLGYDTGYQDGYNFGNAGGYDAGYNAGYDSGYSIGQSDGANTGYQAGYNAGYNEGSTQNETAVAIFSGIISVGLIPINFFLACLNFEVFGINIGSFVSALLTIAIVVIITRMIVSGGNGGGDN